MRACTDQPGLPLKLPGNTSAVPTVMSPSRGLRPTPWRRPGSAPRREVEPLPCRRPGGVRSTRVTPARRGLGRTSRTGPRRGSESAKGTRRGRETRLGSVDILDDFYEFVGAESMLSGVVDELSGELDDRPAFGGTDDRDAAATPELKESFVAQHPQCAQHRVGIDPQNGGQVLCWWQALWVNVRSSARPSARS